MVQPPSAEELEKIKAEAVHSVLAQGYAHTTNEAKDFIIGHRDKIIAVIKERGEAGIGFFLLLRVQNIDSNFAFVTALWIARHYKAFCEFEKALGSADVAYVVSLFAYIDKGEEATKADLQRIFENLMGENKSLVLTPTTKLAPASFAVSTDNEVWGKILKAPLGRQYIYDNEGNKFAHIDKRNELKEKDYAILASLVASWNESKPIKSNGSEYYAVSKKAFASSFFRLDGAKVTAEQLGIIERAVERLMGLWIIRFHLDKKHVSYNTADTSIDDLEVPLRVLPLAGDGKGVFLKSGGYEVEAWAIKADDLKRGAYYVTNEQMNRLYKLNINLYPKSVARNEANVDVMSRVLSIGFTQSEKIQPVIKPKELAERYAPNATKKVQRNIEKTVHDTLAHFHDLGLIEVAYGVNEGGQTKYTHTTKGRGKNGRKNQEPNYIGFYENEEPSTYKITRGIDRNSDFVKRVFSKVDAFKYDDENAENEKNTNP